MKRSVLVKSGSTNRRDFLRKGAMAGAALFTARILSGNGLVKEGENQSVSNTGLTDDELMKQLGYLDITKAPYLADPTGKTDSTKAIQSAVNDARNKQLVCFFPTGTYIISDTISCEQRVEKLAEPRYTDSMKQSYWDIRTDKIILIGSGRGPRPVIKLAENAPGFDDPSKTKLAVWIWAQTRNDYQDTGEPRWGVEQPNISFGHIMRNIDIDIRGHAGAIGLRHAGSQGSALMDCKVYAEGAYAGFNDCPGQGGGTYNIEVAGGKYGLIASPMFRFPMLAACSFTGQTDAPILFTGVQVPMVLAGCRLESKGNCAIDMTGNRAAGITMVDCVVSVAGKGPAIKTVTRQNIFMENVFIKGASSLQTEDTQLGNSPGWTLVEKYSACGENATNLINGKISPETLIRFGKGTSAPDYEALHDRHWSRIPSFDDPDAVNVRDFGAAGDGTTDDSPAFRKAMAASDKVYLPAGTYKLNEPLVLGSKLKLFSLRTASVEAPSIVTADDPDAVTSVYFISFRGGFEWKAGKGVCSFTRGPVISGNGGGRFFGGGGISRLEGTTRPIHIYALNVERRRTNPQAIINNCSNVSVYYFKSEATVKGFGVGVAENTGNTPMGIVNSKNIKVYCVSGNIDTAEKRPVMQITDSENVQITQIRSFKTGDFPQVNETRGSENISVPSKTAVALFLRD